VTWTAWTIVKAASDRVPGKNLRDFCGRPLVQWILEAASATAGIGAIVVNTDAPDLLRPLVSDLPRVVLRTRPLDLRDPRLDANTLLRRDVEELPELLGGNIVMVHATSPLLRPATLRAAFAALERAPEHDSLFAVSRRQARFFLGDGPVNHDPRQLLPTQDLEAVDEENSCIYLTSAEVVRRTGRRIGTSPLRFPVAPSEAVDIDGPEDWRHAQLIARGRGGPPTAVLFDLDGTLIDSLPDVARALSGAVAEHGLGPYETNDLKPWIGHGCRVLIERAMAAGGREIDESAATIASAFLTLYRRNAVADTKVYPGVEQLLDGLAARGIPLAICTNKPWVTTEPVLDALGWRHRFGAVFCPEHAPEKPDPTMLHAALDQLRAAPSGAVYVGDSESDATASARAGIPFAWAAWGYAESPLKDEVKVDSAAGLSDVLDDLGAWGRPLLR
jgi:phosphoglycolate phosphatase